MMHVIAYIIGWAFILTMRACMLLGAILFGGSLIAAWAFVLAMSDEYAGRGNELFMTAFGFGFGGVAFGALIGFGAYYLLMRFLNLANDTP